MPADVSRALADLARAFAELGRRWYVFGAQAVAAAGVPRFTADIDVTVEAAPRDLEVLVNAFAKRRLTPRDVADLPRFVAETRVVPVVHGSGLPVDVVLAGPGLEEEMLARVRLRKIGKMEIPFIETGDLVVLKVLAGRPKDLEDVRALLRLHPADLDVEVARERLGRLAEVLEDEGLLATLDRMASEARQSLPTKRRAARPSPTRK